MLGEEKMKAVIYDMARAGEFVNSYILPRNANFNREETLNTWYTEVYKLHKITKADFDTSYSYYKNRPEIMKQMLDSIAVIPSPTIPTLSKPDSVTKKLDTLKKRPDTARLIPANKDSLLRKKLIRKDLRID